MKRGFPDNINSSNNVNNNNYNDNNNNNNNNNSNNNNNNNNFRRNDSNQGDQKRARPDPVPQQQTQGQGQGDRQVIVQANYFHTTLAENAAIYQYDIEFTPAIESRRLRGGMLKNLVDVIGDFIVADRQLFLLRDIPAQEFHVESRPRNGAPQAYRIIIKPVGIVRNVNWIFNLLIKKLMRAKPLEQIGGAYFDPTRAVKIFGFAELWPGYFSSLQRIQAGNYLLVDRKFKLVRAGETVLNEINVNSMQKTDESLVGKIVITGYNKKYYRISRIDYTVNPRTKKFMKNGQEISVWDYMQTAHRDAMATVRDPNQPLLVCEIRRPSTGHSYEIYLLPELCWLTGLKKAEKDNKGIMDTFKEKTLVPPQARKEGIRSLIEDFANPKLREKAQLRSWRIEISRDLIQLDATVLQKPFLKMKSKDYQEAKLDSLYGEWIPHQQNLNYYTVPHNPTGVNWTVILPSGLAVRDRFTSDMKWVANGAGVNLSEPVVNELTKTDGEDYLAALVAMNPLVNFVLCILPTNNEDRYNKIKGAMIAARPVVSQCVLRSTISDPKKMKSVCTKLVQQIVGKLGGAPWILGAPICGHPIMIIGVDVSHNKGKPSVVGFVATMNNNAAKHYSRAIRIQEGQLVMPIGEFVKEAANHFFQIHEKYPETLIIYRDGLGESQMKGVISEEFAKVQAAAPLVLEKLYVVVQKRIDTRFFKVEARDFVSNVESGTCVDQGVNATPEKHQEIGTTYDFFLVSQSHKQGVDTPKKPAANSPGTSNPTRYWVKYARHPEFKKQHTTNKDLERITFSLCHMFYNWSGTVSTPSVCKYAKALASLVSKSLGGRDVAPTMYEKLGYL